MEQLDLFANAEHRPKRHLKEGQHALDLFGVVLMCFGLTMKEYYLLQHLKNWCWNLFHGPCLPSLWRVRTHGPCPLLLLRPGEILPEVTRVELEQQPLLRLRVERSRHLQERLGPPS